MKTKNYLLALAAGILALGCQCGSVNSTSASLSNEADTASFYIGYLFGTNLQRMGMRDADMAVLVAGMNSALQKKDIKATPQEMDMFVGSYLQRLAARRAVDNLEKGRKFLADNLKRSGVDTLTDGIQYEIIKAGTGAKPAVTDVVKVHYRGTLIDGTEFDSSYARNEPAEFPLNRVIPGWTKSLKEMPVGSKWKIYIPSEQAYGQRGGGSIGPNETLIFEVELLEIVTPDK